MRAIRRADHDRVPHAVRITLAQSASATMPPYEAPMQACELDDAEVIEHAPQHFGLVVAADAGKVARPAPVPLLSSLPPR